MSTVGLELTNFINTDLTWKTVAKRYRSAKRRARNFTSRTELSDRGQGKVDEATVSDNEKHGVAILGCRFSDKVEHIPIKKRRSVASSPSPTSRILSPCLEMPEPTSNGKRRCRGKDASIAAKVKQKPSKGNDDIFHHVEDFSGIEILATVACNNSMINGADHDEDGTQEIVDSSTSAMPSGETAASPKDLVYVDKTDTLSLQDSALTGLPKSPTTKDSKTVEEDVSSRDGRLHWDLNLMMDAWEQPPDILSKDSQANVEQSIPVTSVEPKDDTTKPLDRVVLTDVHVDYHVSTDLKGLPHGICGSSEGESKFDACSGIDRKHDELVQSSTDNAWEPSVSNGADTKASCQVANMEVHLDHSRVPEEKEDVSPAGPTIKQSIKVCPLDGQMGNILCTENELEMPTIASSDILKLEMVAYEIDGHIQKVDAKDSQRASVSYEDGNSNQAMVNLDGDQPIAPSLLGGEPGIKTEEFSDHQPLHDNGGHVSTPDEPVVAGLPVVTLNAKGEANEASPVNTAEVNSPEHSGSEELMQVSSADSTVTPVGASRVHVDGPVSSLAKVLTTDCPSDDSFGSDVYQDHKVHMVGTENTLELQAGYDSQFEDGELRETDERYYWDENEEEDGEVEHVDYAFDDEEEGLCGVGGEKEMKVERRPSPGSDNLTRKTEQPRTGDALREDSVSPKMRTSDVTSDKDISFGVGASGACNRELLPCIEERDSIRRQYGIPRSRADNSYSVYSRDEREGHSKKLVGRDGTVSHMHGRSPSSRRFANPSAGCWDSERCYSPTYRGIYPSGPPRPKSIVERPGHIMVSDHADSERTAYNGGFDNRQRPFINFKYNGVHEHVHRRRRSLTNRDDAYGMNASTIPLRDTSLIRGTFRRYSQGVSSGIKEEYHMPMREDNTEYSSRMAHRFRRERSISPVGRVRPHYTLSYKRSRSRSRSHSPAACLAPRERNEGSRVRGGSPSFRADARMGRVRLPFHKCFAAGRFEEGFASSRISPQRNLRWLNDQNGTFDDTRRRKSPIGMFRQSHRFDTARSMRRLNSDDQFRTMRKFPNVGVSGRGGEYEGSDDDGRKYGDRTGRYVLRRFQYKAEDSSSVGNDYRNNNYDDCNRVTDRRIRGAIRRSNED